MKRRRIILIALTAVLTMLMSSCVNDDPVFDGDLIVGKWVSGTEYYRYDSDGTGATWDTADDVTEEEAQPYTWEFDSKTNGLVLVHQMEMGGQIPKSYTVTNLTSTVFEYKDRYGQTYSFNRVN